MRALDLLWSRGFGFWVVGLWGCTAVQKRSLRVRSGFSSATLLEVLCRCIGLFVNFRVRHFLYCKLWVIDSAGFVESADLSHTP